MENKMYQRYMRVGGQVCCSDVIQYAAARVEKNPEYRRAYPIFLWKAYCLSESYRARIDRKTWVMRDDRIGELSRPVSVTDWPECTPDDARESLARHVWAMAVKFQNLESSGSGVSVDAEFGTIKLAAGIA